MRVDPGSQVSFSFQSEKRDNDKTQFGIVFGVYPLVGFFMAPVVGQLVSRKQGFTSRGPQVACGHRRLSPSEPQDLNHARNFPDVQDGFRGSIEKSRFSVHRSLWFQLVSTVKAKNMLVAGMFLDGVLTIVTGQVLHALRTWILSFVLEIFSTLTP